VVRQGEVIEEGGEVVNPIENVENVEVRKILVARRLVDDKDLSNKNNYMIII